MTALINVSTAQAENPLSCPASGRDDHGRNECCFSLRHRRGFPKFLPKGDANANPVRADEQR